MENTPSQMYLVLFFTHYYSIMVDVLTVNQFSGLNEGNMQKKIHNTIQYKLSISFVHRDA